MLGFEFQKQIAEKHGWDGKYTLFMKQRLGEKGFAALCGRAASTIKQKEAIIRFQLYISSLEKTQKDTERHRLDLIG